MHGLAKCAMRTGVCFLASWLSAAAPAEAFLYPLSPEEVREAYFLGRTTQDEEVVKFIEPYLHRLPYPQKGPYVESVEFRTPYEQIVLKTRQNLSNYSSQDAEHYSQHPELVVIRVLIFLTFTYQGPDVKSPADTVRLWTYQDLLKDFAFRVEQQRDIRPKKIVAGPACPFPNQCEPFDGFEVLLQFEADQFTSEKLTVQVTTSNGQDVRSEFDLAKLK